MEWRRYITTGTLVTFVGGAIAHAYAHPFDPKKEHDEPTGIYSVVRSTGNLTVIGSGTIDTPITPGTGTLTIEGQEVLKVAEDVKVKLI